MERKESVTYPGYWLGEDGSVVGPRGWLLKPKTTFDGYPVISVYPNGRLKTVRVHVLVCETFHGPKPSPSHQVAHNDGNPANGAASNLRWVTGKENAADRRVHGRDRLGEDHYAARLTANQVLNIRRRHAGGMSISGLARELSVGTSTIWQIVHRKNWTHI